MNVEHILDALLAGARVLDSKHFYRGADYLSQLMERLANIYPKVQTQDNTVLEPDLQNHVNQQWRRYEGAPAHITNNMMHGIYNLAHIKSLDPEQQQQLMSQPQKYTVQSFYRKHSDLNPYQSSATYSGITSAMLGAMMKTKMYIDRARYKFVQHGEIPYAQYMNAPSLKSIYIAFLEPMLTKLGVDKSHMEGIVDRVQKYDDRSFQIRVGDADEAMRFYEYEIQHKENFPDVDFNDLTDDQLNKLAPLANNALGYDNGSDMYARKSYVIPTTPIDHELTKVNNPFSAEDRITWIKNEMKRHQYNTQGLQLSNTLPTYAPQFLKQKKKVPVAPTEPWTANAQPQPRKVMKYYPKPAEITEPWAENPLLQQTPQQKRRPRTRPLAPQPMPSIDPEETPQEWSPEVSQYAVASSNQRVITAEALGCAANILDALGEFKRAAMLDSILTGLSANGRNQLYNFVSI